MILAEVSRQFIFIQKGSASIKEALTAFNPIEKSFDSNKAIRNDIKNVLERIIQKRLNMVMKSHLGYLMISPFLNLDDDQKWLP